MTGVRRMLLKWLFRSDLANPDPWLMAAFGGPMTATGIRINADNAMRLTAVYGAVRILAETIATLPLIIYRRTPNDGKERATDYFLYPLLHDQPNEEQTSVEFREMLQGHLALRGNAFAQIDRKFGRPARLVPLHPDRVEVRRERGELIYKINPPDAPSYSLRRAAGEILHIRALSSDGNLGLNPIELFREAMGLGLAYEEYSARLFSNGANLNGVLETPQAMSDQALKRFREIWQQNYGGLGNAGKTAILEQGMKWQNIGIAPKDSEFINSRKFQLTEIARIFRVPPHMLADLERSTFSNIEHQSLEFIRDTIRPWLVRWEQALTRDLIPPEDRPTYFVEFLIDGLLRGDLKTRYDAYAIGRNNGWLSANDIRRMENMNPLPPEEGDVYLIPLNMVPAGAAPESPKTTIQPTDDSSARAHVQRIFQPLLIDVARRMIRREVNDLRRSASKLNGDQREEFLRAFYADFADAFRNAVIPILRAYAEATDCPNADRWAHARADGIVEKYVNASLRQLDGGDNAIAKWEEIRPAEIAEFIAA